MTTHDPGSGVGTPTSPASEEWTPSVTLDVLNAGQKAFDDTYRDFYRINRDRSLRTGLLTTGWNTVTPQISEELLLAKANRRLSVAQIAYYARQQMDGQWQATGEPIIINKNGVMDDGYHRCWASLLSRASFTTFVVTDVAPHLAAFIDNGKSRSDADALQMTGLNGLSGLISAVVKIAVRFGRGYYQPHSRVRVDKMTPTEVLAYVQANPTIRDAVHEVVAEHKSVLSILLSSKKDVSCFVAWRILDLYGEDVVEDFFLELANEDATGPIGLLRAKLVAEVDSQGRGYKPKLNKREVLAFMIKAFNAWQSGSTMRRLILGTDEAFPEILIPEIDADEDETVGFGSTEQEVHPEA